MSGRALWQLCLPGMAQTAGSCRGVFGSGPPCTPQLALGHISPTGPLQNTSQHSEVSGILLTVESYQKTTFPRQILIP